jgi:tetratricopeptide (TPR) repeat protein
MKEGDAVMKNPFIPVLVATLAGTLAAADTQAPAAAPVDAAREACLNAIPGYEATLAANPKDVVVNARVGVCYQRTGQVDRAIRAYKAALAVEGRQAVTLNNLGAAYHSRGELRQAVKQYRKALRIDPKLAGAHKNLGIALIGLGDTREGFEALSRAFAVAPELFGTSTAVVRSGMDPDRLALQYYYMAKLSAAAGKVDAALEFLRQARDLGYDDVATLNRDPDFKDVKSDARFAALGW